MTAVDDWQDALSEAGQLTPALLEQIVTTHGDRGRRAIDAVAEGRVKGYRDFTVVVGHTEEYVVEDDGCHCPDATYNLGGDPEELCWHAIAVRIARATDRVDDHDLYYADVEDIL
ncbi:MAG: hypothetical protein ACOCYZ_05715 [Halococcoides sp.]